MNELSVNMEDDDEKPTHKRKDSGSTGNLQPMYNIDVRRSSVGICKLDDIIELYRKEISYEKLSSCFDDIKHHIERQAVMIDSVFDVIRLTMEFVEESSLFDTGIERKQYVIAVLKLICLEQEVLSGDVSKNLKRLINTNMLSDVIELLIYTSKGYLRINRKKRWFC
jgi:hypothetical protein